MYITRKMVLSSGTPSSKLLLLDSVDSPKEVEPIPWKRQKNSSLKKERGLGKYTKKQKQK